jgi:hypothetical protein
MTAAATAALLDRRSLGIYAASTTAPVVSGEWSSSTIWYVQRLQEKHHEKHSLLPHNPFILQKIQMPSSSFKITFTELTKSFVLKFPWLFCICKITLPIRLP